jgi:hypothetical protein
MTKFGEFGLPIPKQIPPMPKTKSSETKMNERIRELMNQSGYKPLPGFDFANSLEETYLKKFAELIVQECMLCGDNLAKHYINTHPEKEQVWLLAAIADYANEIEKQFGVKE